MSPLVMQDESYEQLDPIANNVADAIGGFGRRSTALRVLLKKVRDRLDRNDSDARKFLGNHPHTFKG